MAPVYVKTMFASVGIDVIIINHDIMLENKCAIFRAKLWTTHVVFGGNLVPTCDP